MWPRLLGIQCHPALASRVSRMLVCRLPCPDPPGHYLMAAAIQRGRTHQTSRLISHSYPAAGFPLPPALPRPHSLCLAACLKNQYLVCLGTALLRGRCSQPSSCSHSAPNILGFLRLSMLPVIFLGPYSPQGDTFEGNSRLSSSFSGIFWLNGLHFSINVLADWHSKN